MTCSFRTRPDCHHDSVEGEVVPPGCKPHLDVIRGHHFDHPSGFEERRFASKRQFFPGQFELGQPRPESGGSRLSGPSALSGGGQRDGNRVESRLDEVGTGQQAQVVGADRQQFPAPVAF